MHDFWTSTFDGRLILAPVEQPKEILDIGCGTGLWAMEVADEFPDCEVYGIDLAPIQEVFVPQNCTFHLENVLNGPIFQDEKFDLIQSRCLAPGFPDRRWPDYIAEIWRMTKPLGWIQLIELDPIRRCDDGSMPVNSALAEYERIAMRVMKESYATTIHGALPKMARHVQKAGFINIKQIDIKTPLGNWTSGTFVCWSRLTIRQRRMENRTMYGGTTEVCETSDSGWHARMDR